MTRGSDLLRLPVRTGGVALGTPVDLLLDLEGRRAIGLEVLCRDEVLRYLPLGGARVRADEIAVGSSLVLLEERDLAWYRRRARALSSLRGAPVRRDGAVLGLLADVLVDPGGAVRELVVEDGGRTLRVALDATIEIAAQGSASAA